MVEIRNLKTFYYAATTLNFSEAAKQMNYTQPAVTLQIKKMEEEFGCELFKQVGKYKELTESGVIVFEATKKILNILSSMESDLKHSGKNETQVSIASDINFLKNHLLKKLEDIYLNDQEITVELNVVEDSTDILLGVQNKKYDIGVVHGKYEEWNMKCLEVQKNQVLAIYSSKIDINSDDYNRLPLIKYKKRTMYSSILSRFIEENQLDNRRTIEVDSIEMVRNSVMKGLGIGVLTEDVVKTDLDNQRVKIVPTQVALSIDANLVFLPTALERKHVKRAIETFEKI
ncbi:LysR family transcriptional regulator [Niallia sp. 03133]|uniref:LysR family transcriptional regulator n=1 Tax=Niallia sp. 03133 TaxID=3458060 RepID=UPI004043C81B